MNLSPFGYAILAVILATPIVGIYAAARAHNNGSFHSADAGTIFGSPSIFMLVGYFRPELQVGWAMLFWPIILGTSATYLFALKITVIDPWLSKPRTASIMLFAFCNLASALLAVTVGPWYE